MTNKSVTQKMRGFSMIEVLIAVLILAVGLLGVAALQLSSVKSGSEGYYRSQATAIAEDFASRIRASREMARAPISESASPPPWAWPLWGSDFTEVNPDGDPDTDDSVVHNADPSGAMQAYMDNFVDADGFDCAAAVTLCRTDGSTAANDCTFTQLIAYDNYESCLQASTLLPVGTLRSKRNGSRMTIAVSWRAEGAYGASSSIRNPLCATEFADFPATDDCVLLEVVP